MRRCCVGALFLVIFHFITPAGAQPSGSVEGLGFQNIYRPDCWTPIHITLRADSGKSDQYQIQVKQEDMDRDHPVFTRMISLTGNAAGSSVRDQKFHMYFKPQPTGDGLPDSNEPLAELQAMLPVSLCTSGGKWLSNLPISTTINNIDPKSGPFASHRGTRLILAVSDGSSHPVSADYENAIGILEDVKFVTVHAADLPESVLGYDAVDAVVWLNADPAELKLGGDERYRALQAYVRRGGSLVICTPTDWQKLLGFADLLPVTISSAETKKDPDPLRTIGRGRNADTLSATELRDGWDTLPGPFTLARATPKPTAHVVDWISWNGQNDQSPWLVRAPVGAGVVTWVAQDLGDVSVTRALRNWPRIWDHVLDLHNETIVVAIDTPDDVKFDFKESGMLDIGYSALSGLELTSKSMWLVTLAIVFFIAYWLLAGPGSYAYLATKHRASLSWFIFALSALAATAVTVLVVRLTLRGAPELRHISLVRAATNEPAIVYSRFGLYIPRDGVQTLELKDMAPNSLATLSAFAIHPQHLVNDNVPDDPGPEYQVMMRDIDSQEPAILRVPYRSTLKKFEADWSGEISGRIEGAGKLSDGQKIDGILTNGTGKRLRNIYIAYFQPDANRPFGGDDMIFFTPIWDPGTSIDLRKKFNPQTADGRTAARAVYQVTNVNPERGDEFRGTLDAFWQPYWFSMMRVSTLGDQKFDDFGARSVRSSIPMLSFFARMKPQRNQRGYPASRFELLRRGARRFDVSPALCAGSLVVLAEGDGASSIPMPLEVEGDKIEGSGSTVYQFILPLDQSGLSPTTQPSE